MTPPVPARQPARLPTRAESIGRVLSERIVSGAVAPGARLDEQALAAEFEVSRTPVREALRQLVATGLVEVRPRRGAVVASPDTARVDASFEVLAELEALGARWAALRMTPRERARFESLHRDMAALVRDSDRDAYRDANVAWHGLVYDGAHNARLQEVLLDTTRRLAPFRGAQFATPQRLAHSHQEHGRVVDGIIGGDAEVAAGAMARHIQSSATSWIVLTRHGRTNPPMPKKQA